MNFVRLLVDLKRDEGFRARPYKDSLGKLTVGYGHYLEDDEITEVAAADILKDDILLILDRLDQHIPWWRDLPEPAARALANMAFNLGVAGVLNFRLMISSLEEGDFTQAAVECLDSKYARQVGNRAVRIADLFLSCNKE
jgi:lysozyme